MKGLTQVPKPYISKVLIEDSKSEGQKQPGFTDLYTEQPGKPSASISENQIKVTFDMALKSLYPSPRTGAGPCGNFKIEQVAQMLNDNVLWYKLITDESTLADFLLAENKLAYFLNKIPGKTQFVEASATPTAVLKASDVSRFLYEEKGIDIVNMPLKAQVSYKYEGSPSFLACVFMYSSLTPTINTSNISFTAEIIFRGGKPPTNTFWFSIDKYYRANGEEFPMRRSLPDTQQPGNDDEYVVLKYGLPGDMWCGPVHRHYVNGAYRYMAGEKHSSAPHPYVLAVPVSNTKIVDNRVVGQIENMFAYNSSNFEKLLNTTTQVLNRTANNTKSTLDAYNSKTAIFSEADYSIKKIAPSKWEIGDSAKAKVNLWFAIDKLLLIKETSTLAPLLDKLTMFDSDAPQFFVDRLNILDIQVSRVNTTTGQKTLLLTSRNEAYATDKGEVNELGVSISKGHTLKTATNFKNKGNAPNITYYEFRDGELDVRSYDDATYTYQVAVKFQDPFVSYLAEKQGKLRTILANLDELLQRSNSKIMLAGPQPDPSSAARYGAQGATALGNPSAAAFNSHLNKYHPQFLEKALSNAGFFTFGIQEGMPVAAATEFSGASLTPDSLLFAFAALNVQNEAESVSSFDGVALSGVLFALAAFLKNSLSLSTTTPTLLTRARTVLGLLEDRLRKLLSLYDSAQKTKGTSNFSYTDYEKSNGNVYWKAAPGNNPGLITFSHTFKEKLSLEKMRNHFDWFAGLPGTSADSDTQFVKMVPVPSYTDAVTHYARSLYKDPSAVPLGQIETGGSPAYLPLINSAGLNLFNQKNKAPFEQKVYQAMRRKLYTRASAKGLPISIPETLSFFGVRFQLNTDDDIAKILAQPGDILQAAAVDNLFWADESSTGGNYYQNEFYDDNFGISYTPVITAPGGFNSIFGVDPSAVTKQNPFGSVFDPRYLWQGGPLEKYPLKTAKSLLTLLFSDNLNNYRELSLYNVQESPFFLGKKMAWPAEHFLTDLIQKRAIQNPAALNLLAQIASETKQGGFYDPGKLSPDTFGKLFDNLGHLRLENYPLYVLFLGLFGKVQYFDGFENAVVTSAKSPTAYNYTNQVIAKRWKPLTQQTLASIGPGEQLYCKVELCLDNKLIDRKFAALFADFETYNQFFYLRGTVAGTPGTTLGTTIGNAITTPASNAAVGTSLPPNLNGGTGLIIEGI